MRAASFLSSILVGIACAGSNLVCATSASPAVIWRTSLTTVDAFPAVSNVVQLPSKPWLIVAGGAGLFAVDNMTGKVLPLEVPFQDASYFPYGPTFLTFDANASTLVAASTQIVAVGLPSHHGRHFDVKWHAGTTSFDPTNDTASYIPSKPLCVAECGTVVVQGKSHVDGFNIATGNHSWRVVAPASSVSSAFYAAAAVFGGAAQVDSHRVVVAQYTGNVTKIDACTGDVVWSVALGDRCPFRVHFDDELQLVFVGCAVRSSSTSTFGSPGNSVVALHVSNGSIAWQHRPEVDTEDITVARGYVFVRQDYMDLVALWAHNGTVAWRNTTSSTTSFSVAALATTSKYLVVVTAEGLSLRSVTTGKLVSNWVPGASTRGTLSAAPSFSLDPTETVAYLVWPGSSQMMAIALP